MNALDEILDLQKKKLALREKMRELQVKVFSTVIGPVVKFVWDTMIGPAVTLIIGGLKLIIDTIAGVIKFINDLIDAWTNWNPAPKSLTVEQQMTEAGMYGVIPGAQFGLSVKRTGLYYLHEGEEVSRGAKIGPINIYAETYQGGKAAGKGFLDELRSMGVYAW
jgi:hypothetical protein